MSTASLRRSPPPETATASISLCDNRGSIPRPRYVRYATTRIAMLVRWPGRRSAVPGMPVIVIPMDDDAALRELACEVALGAEHDAVLKAPVHDPGVVRDEVGYRVPAVVEDDQLLRRIVLTLEVLDRARYEPPPVQRRHDAADHRLVHVRRVPRRGRRAVGVEGPVLGGQVGLGQRLATGVRTDREPPAVGGMTQVYEDSVRAEGTQPGAPGVPPDRGERRPRRATGQDSGPTDPTPTAGTRASRHGRHERRSADAPVR